MSGIKISGIKKSYLVENKCIPVLKGIDLHIPKGKITVVLGRSGCGKTTMLRILGGLEQADTGEIILEQNHKPAFVFQEPRLMPWLTVWDNVIFGMKKKGGCSLTNKSPMDLSSTKGEIQNIIDKVGLHGFEKAYPHQLSGGMRQRAALARALAYEPSFLMMDEPFAALDHFTRDQMQKELILLQQEQGTSIVFVTHSIDEALLLGHKIVVIENGRIKTEFIIEETGERNLLEHEFIERKKNIIEQLQL